MNNPTIKPGIYPGMPAAEYHAIDALSASRLKDLRRSPLHCRDAILHPKESKAMVLGAAVHCAVLEPDRFRTAYCAAPECDRRTREGKAMWQSFMDASGGATILTAEEWEKCEHIRDSVRAHPSASILLDDEGPVELSIFWNDPTYRILCKARIDKVANGVGALVDLKTTMHAGPDEFIRSIWTFGYHLQAHWYLTGADAVGLDADGMAFIAVETDAPYAAGTYQLTPRSLALARDQIDPLVRRYAECQQAGQWPGYGVNIVEVELEQWMERRINTAILEGSTT